MSKEPEKVDLKIKSDEDLLAEIHKNLTSSDDDGSDHSDPHGRRATNTNTRISEQRGSIRGEIRKIVVVG